MVIEHEEIKHYLRQRSPFLLVDRVVEVTSERLKAIKNVTGTDHCLDGHFPDEPVFPGVLLLEALSQAGGLYLALSSSASADMHRGYLAKVDKVKFKRFIRPGDQIVLEAYRPVLAGSMARVNVMATVAGDAAAEGEITYYFAAEKPEQQIREAVAAQ
jgi:3-hydroxyacyl-[acyl-carrier-protein] dehydratase